MILKKAFDSGDRDKLWAIMLSKGISTYLITMEELETTIKALKPRKSAGSDGINNELYKHAPKSFLHKFLNFLNVCWIHRDIPEEWRTAVVIPIHKK